MWQCFTQPRRPNALNSVHVKALSNPYMICMKMKIVDRAEKKAVSARNGTKTIRKWPVPLLLLLLPVTFGLRGCADEYAAGARPGYGPGHGGGYGPGYVRHPGYGHGS